MEYLVKDVATGAEEPLVLNQVIKGESNILLRIDAVERLFKPGERVRFTPAEFVGVCFTLASVGQELSVSLSEHARRKGFPIPAAGDT